MFWSVADTADLRMGSVGRRGPGPWEFLTMASACRTRGDTIVAFDAGTRRLSVLAADGRPSHMTDVAALGIVPMYACLGGGGGITVTPTADRDNTSMLASLRTVQTDGTPQDSLGRVPFMAEGTGFRWSIVAAHVQRRRGIGCRMGGDRSRWYVVRSIDTAAGLTH